jgi:hypothetical protein
MRTRPSKPTTISSSSRRCATQVALFLTLVGGLVITQVLRYTLQDRPWIGIFFAVAFGFIGLATFGWRAVAVLVRRLRPAAT